MVLRRGVISSVTKGLNDLGGTSLEMAGGNLVPIGGPILRVGFRAFLFAGVFGV